MSDTIDLNIRIDHLTRVEGHGNIVVDMEAGELTQCKLEIVEAPRFFEAMLEGRLFTEAPHITCRICGICSVGHTTAALRAAETAIGFSPSRQTVQLRKAMLHAEFIQSHILHLYFLAAPDFLGVGSVIPLAETHKDVVKRALRLKKLANDACAVIGGRHVHPISLVVGGFTKLPTVEELQGLRDTIVAALPDVVETVALFKTLEIPHFLRKTEYISLKSDEEYALYEGDIYSSYGVMLPPRRYRHVTNEHVLDHSTAKRTRTAFGTFMVGALARVNNNFDQLSEGAKAVADELGFKTPCFNPFMNNVAQLIETRHCIDDLVAILDDLIATGIVDEIPDPQPKAGRGVGAVEVPRGILYHDYEIDAEGILTQVNCIIPTGQNLSNIEADMRELVHEVIDEPKDQIALKLEMLVRAYDPCISCSTHILDVEFV